MIGPLKGWLAAGGLVGLALAYGGGQLHGRSAEKTKCKADVLQIENKALRGAVSRQSELASQNAGLALAADLRARAAEKEVAEQKPKIVTRYRTIEKLVEQSNDDILKARLPVDISREFNCLLDPRPGTGECDRIDRGAATGDDGQPADVLPADPATRAD